MPGSIKPPFHPIIYVRGYAMTPGEIAATVADPYMGLNLGSTKVRQTWDRKVSRHIFESPLIRLMKEYEYRGRTIQAYMQLGNGSQNAIFIPDLDLAIATFGANYNSPSINYLLNVLLPTYILPAVDPRG